MKILIILLKWEGGVGTVIKNISNILKNKGHKVDIFSREDDLKSNSFINSIFKIRNFVKNKMKENNYDIIYTQDWSIGFPLIFPFPIFKNKHYCCFHGNSVSKGKLFQNFVGNYMKEKIIVVGDSIKLRFKNSNIVYNGVDTNSFKSLNKKREYIGWINKSSEKISEEYINKFSSKLNMKKIIAKEIKLKNMNEFYNKCKIFISIPNKSAGFNLCWLEAMSSGVPIIIGNDN